MKKKKLAVFGVLGALVLLCAAAAFLLMPPPEASADIDGLLSYRPRDAERIVYGASGRGRELVAWEFGSGQDVLVLTFCLHGYEDGFPRDGACLVYTANRLMESLSRWDLSGWTVYVLPCCNPDGLINGYTNDGPGRCTTAYIRDGAVDFGSGADINRCFPTGWVKCEDGRNFNGDNPLACAEAVALADFLTEVRGEGYNFCIDVHGWYAQVLTSSGKQGALYTLFSAAFPENTWADLNSGTGYLTAWAAMQGYECCLFEFPPLCDSYDSFVHSGAADRFIATVKTLING